MAKYLFQVSVFLFAMNQASESNAQVFNAPLPQSQSTQSTQSSVPTQGGVQTAGGPVAPTPSGAVEQTGWGIPMPRITMPKITMPKINMPDVSAVTGPVKSGFGKVKLGATKAWEGTKEMFSLGSSKPTARSRVASQQQPSFWQRLTARDSQPQVPQTVGEFMSQPRLDP